MPENAFPGSLYVRREVRLFRALEYTQPVMEKLSEQQTESNKGEVDIFCCGVWHCLNPGDTTASLSCSVWLAGYWQFAGRSWFQSTFHLKDLHDVL